MRSLNKDRRILGLVGYAASGKDTVALVLTHEGFTHISLSDILRQEILERGMVTSRKLQAEVANELRCNHGGDYFMRKIAENIRLESKLVISGLYSVSEGVSLRDEFGGDIIQVIASHNPEEDLLIRYHRLMTRNDGSRDQLTYTEFLESNIREASGLLSSEANIRNLMNLAKYTILNAPDTSADDIRTQLLPIIERSA